MADTVETITPAPLVNANIDTSAIQAAPVVTTEASPVNAITPTVTPEVAPAEAPKPAETLLGTVEKPAEAVVTPEITPVVEAPKEGETPPETKNEGGQSEETAPPPKYESFTLPEDIKLDDTKLGEFTNLLAELETSGKADHAAVQAFGQKAVEFYVNEVKSTVANVFKVQNEAWDKVKVGWKEQFLADPEIGGNRFQTTVDAAKNFIRTHGGTEEQQQEFRGLMETSGLGNHPAMIRILAKAGMSMSEGGPLAAMKPVSAPRSKVSTLYGAN